MTSWEYRTFIGKHSINNGITARDQESDISEINRLGSLGWELCNVQPQEQITISAIITSVKLVQVVYFFKRPLSKEKT